MAEFDCEETKSLVHEYLHNELGVEYQEGITTHLALCDSCEEEYDLEVNLNKAITRSCDEEPPQQLAEKVLDLIRKSEPN
jgi:anti-sigma factor (TIGR02949 family)